jgi:hypothetical protein
MCRIGNGLEREGRVDAIPPIVGALVALAILLIILAAWIAMEAVI